MLQNDTNIKGIIIIDVKYYMTLFGYEQNINIEIFEIS
jgi:hypothetical protein